MRTIIVYIFIIMIVNIFKNLGNQKATQEKEKNTTSAPMRRKGRGILGELLQEVERAVNPMRESQQSQQNIQSIDNVKIEEVLVKETYQPTLNLRKKDKFKENEDIGKIKEPIEPIMSDIQRAIVMSEVLDKPLALRK